MASREVTDQTGRKIDIPFPPRRIVSVVPSQTELLFDLGLDEEVAGITWFCIHPADKVKGKAKVGGTKNLKPEKIKALQPDLIIANKEENEKAQIEALAAEYPVWISEIYSIEDSVEMIRQVGLLTGREQKASEIAATIEKDFSTLSKAGGQKALYLIWKGPYMAAARHTFIHHILERCGFRNACEDMERYPELDEKAIQALAPDLVFLSSEPYPFKEKHIAELQSLLPNARIMLVDGEMFSWYGSRLLRAKHTWKT